MQGALSSSTEQLYHSRDSHWNNLGALYAWREIMDTANRSNDLFDQADYIWEQNWRGDLEDMIFPAFDIMDQQANFEVDWNYEITSNYHGEDDILIKTENNNGEGKLLLFRDSFGNALLPFFAQSYKEAMFSRAVPYDLKNAGEYDTVVIEIVERNLANLIRTAPIMLAPARQEQGVQVAADVHTREKNGLLHIYGTFSGDAEHIYLQLSNGEDVLVVEAFPILEKDLLEGEATALSENGFSAYLSKEYKNYSVKVLID